MLHFWNRFEVVGIAVASPILYLFVHAWFQLGTGTEEWYNLGAASERRASMHCDARGSLDLGAL
jgi:hypothetical protein